MHIIIGGLNIANSQGLLLTNTSSYMVSHCLLQWQISTVQYAQSYGSV